MLPPVTDTPEQTLPPAGSRASANGLRLSLAFVAAITGVSVIAWGSAKVACNLHPPGYQAFKPSTLEQLARTPKAAALEFHHRLATYDFTGARELLKGDEALVAKPAAACDANCLEGREARVQSVLTRATLLRAEAETAQAKVEAHFQGQVNSATYELVRDGKIWKVSKRVD